MGEKRFKVLTPCQGRWHPDLRDGRCRRFRGTPS